MRQEFKNWLIEKTDNPGSRATIWSKTQKIEDCYGDLEQHFSNGALSEIENELRYSKDDERSNKPNPSRIPVDGNIYNSLASYRNYLAQYQKFLTEQGTGVLSSFSKEGDDFSTVPQMAQESVQQRFALERDMQRELRRNISLLDPRLKIIDEGVERKVDSGLIDITCEDDEGIVVVELKAGKADGRAIAQIQGYMGDLLEEESTGRVRGILIAHDFDRRAKAAARVVPTLQLVEYSIEFRFNDVSVV